tara:strand:+ start:7015 stop:8154 length:1140 start_codon:yes stop_codon:yes gene_type:complete
MRRLLFGPIAGLLFVATTPPAIANGNISFTEIEKAAILSHGPWPPKFRPDPSNRVSGKKSAVTFGRELFRSRFLSRSRRHSCLTCHNPDLAYADGLTRSSAIATVDRNAIALANLRLNWWYGWDGSSDNLWAQSIRPILDPREMNATAGLVAERIRSDVPFSRGYKNVFDSNPKSDDNQKILVNLGKALAAFQETIVTPPSRFDEFRSALENNNLKKIGRYPLAAKRGLKTFIGKGKCNLCHLGPNFTNGEFDDAGVRYFKASGGVDKGRYGGIQNLKKSPYTLLGKFNDNPKNAPGIATQHVARSHQSWGQFRVPSLRNISKTAPFMHDGSVPTLRDVVRHYSELNEERLHLDGSGLLRRLNLSEREISDLVAFLKTL